MVSDICAAKNCYNSRKNHPNKAFFGFPCDVSLCKIWLENSGRSDLDVIKVSKSNSYYKLCADHFEVKCFTDSSKTVLLRKRLNPVPTIFFNNLGSLLPQGIQSERGVNIDLPSEPLFDVDESANLCECVLNPVDHTVKSQHMLISYHSAQTLYGKRKEEFDPATISKALLNLKPETELYQIDDLCRLCMNKAIDGVELFLKTAKAKEIRRICDLVMPNKIDICDGLPHKICKSCLRDLKKCHKLIEKFKNAYLYLRSISRYSLFIENEDDGSIEADIEENKDYLKPIPKHAIVMPLKNFNCALGDSQNYLKCDRIGCSTRVDKGLETSNLPVTSEMSSTVLNTETISTDIETERPVTVNPVNEDLQSLPLSTRQINLITDDGLWQDDVDLLCRPNNAVNTSSKDDESQKSCATSTSFYLTPEKPQNISLSNLNNLEKHKVNELDTSDFTNQDQFVDQENLKCHGKGTVLEICGVAVKETVQSVYETNTALTDESCLTVTYKCLECFKIFTSYPALAEHVSSTHQKLKQLNSGFSPCSFCSEQFQNRTLLKRHLKVRHQDKKIICSKCKNSTEKFCNKFELDKHMKEKHSHSCSVCKAILYTKDKLDKHFAKCHDNQTICSICGKQFKHSRSRRFHEMRHTQDFSEVCWICGVILKSEQGLRIHMKLHNGEIYTCEICEKPLNTPNQLTKHRKSHRPEFREKNFLCEYCPKQFRYKQALNNHVLTHSTTTHSTTGPRKLNTKPYKCDHCGKGFNQKNNLLHHEKKRKITNGICTTRLVGALKLKENPSHECDICGRKFFKLASVERHRKYHFCIGNTEIVQKLLDEPEVHKCDVCGRYFFSKLSLQHHMRNHTGTLSPFKCDFCGKSFPTTFQVIAHERCHTDLSHKCNFCEKTFRIKKNLEIHEILHTQDNKTYICKICDKKFKTRRCFLQHTYLHEENYYTCEECGQLCKTLKNLRLHIRSRHKEKEENIKENEDQEPQVEVEHLNNYSQDVSNIIDLEMEDLTFIVSSKEDME